MLRVGITNTPQEELAAVQFGDLFGFANSLAARIRGAVTIEDPQSHVLAYSSIKGEVDEPRKETILGRQVPQKYMRVLQERGVFRQLLTSDDVVYMDAMPEVHLSRRVAISVRAAGELFGSIWVAQTDKPLVDNHRAILQEAAQAAALHIMRHRLELQAENNLHRSMVRDLLDGTAADVAAVRLALDPEAPYAVVAFEAVGGGVPSNRLLQVIDLYCSAFRRAAGATHAQVLAAIGRSVTSVNRVAESRHDADRVMRVLLRPETSRTVADLDEVRAMANLLEVLDLLRERPHLQEGSFRLLNPGGSDRGVALITTLRAYLDHFGDISAAAASMQVHPNTFRYRLRRATDLTGVHLEDPMERLMLSLQLRLLS